MIALRLSQQLDLGSHGDERCRVARSQIIDDLQSRRARRLEAGGYHVPRLHARGDVDEQNRVAADNSLGGQRGAGQR